MRPVEVLYEKEAISEETNRFLRALPLSPHFVCMNTSKEGNNAVFLALALISRLFGPDHSKWPETLSMIRGR
jgi:hypothetical protein